MLSHALSKFRPSFLPRYSSTLQILCYPIFWFSPMQMELAKTQSHTTYRERIIRLSYGTTIWRDEAIEENIHRLIVCTLSAGCIFGGSLPCASLGSPHLMLTEWEHSSAESAAIHVLPGTLGGYWGGGRCRRRKNEHILHCQFSICEHFSFFLATNENTSTFCRQK